MNYVQDLGRLNNPAKWMIQYPYLEIRVEGKHLVLVPRSSTSGQWHLEKKILKYIEENWSHITHYFGPHLFIGWEVVRHSPNLVGLEKVQNKIAEILNIMTSKTLKHFDNVDTRDDFLHSETALNAWIVFRNNAAYYGSLIHRRNWWFQEFPEAHQKASTAFKTCTKHWNSETSSKVSELFQRIDFKPYSWVSH